MSTQQPQASARSATDILEGWGEGLRADVERDRTLADRLSVVLAVLLAVALLVSIAAALLATAGELHPALLAAIVGGSAAGCALIWASLSRVRAELDRLQQRLNLQAHALVAARATAVPADPRRPRPRRRGVRAGAPGPQPGLAAPRPPFARFVRAPARAILCPPPRGPASAAPAATRGPPEEHA